MQTVTDLPGPPSVQVTSEKIDALKRRAQEIARDLRSRNDTWISYLETLEQRDHDNLMLAQMIAR
jgi:transglutaminase-like putative cysteine protease